jgi:hypothetical protein
MAASKVVAALDKDFAVLIFQYKCVDISQVAEWKLEMIVRVPRSPNIPRKPRKGFPLISRRYPYNMFRTP